ncbi:hypothetical protein pb186bvf_009497 [Paramecium bursaria]
MNYLVIMNKFLLAITFIQKYFHYEKLSLLRISDSYLNYLILNKILKNQIPQKKIFNKNNFSHQCHQVQVLIMKSVKFFCAVRLLKTKNNVQSKFFLLGYQKLFLILINFLNISDHMLQRVFEFLLMQ